MGVPDGPSTNQGRSVEVNADHPKMRTLISRFFRDARSRVAVLQSRTHAQPLAALALGTGEKIHQASSPMPLSSLTPQGPAAYGSLFARRPRPQSGLELSDNLGSQPAGISTPLMWTDQRTSLPMIGSVDPGQGR